MEGQRHIERRETLVYWKASDAEKCESVGLVTNISEKGVQIHSDHAFNKGDSLTIRVEIDPRLKAVEDMTMLIENVWCEASRVSGVYCSGFKIVDISDRAKRNMQNLFEIFSYPAPGGPNAE